MDEKFTPYLERQFANPSIALQYRVSNPGNVAPIQITGKFSTLDPLAENTHQPVKGLIHKYENRALVKVSYRCAAHCQFCTRLRQIGTPDGDLDLQDDVTNIVEYIRQHSEITDVILSGGDPFYNPKQTLRLLDHLVAIPSVKVIRIGTRLPVHNPPSFEAGLVKSVVERIAEIARIKPFVVLINFEHPDELTPETLHVVRMLKATGALLLAQTVFLKGINDNYDILKNLFEGLYWNGVMPYYIYRCDYVNGLEHFVCDMEDEIRIMTDLRRNLSGDRLSDLHPRC